MQYRADPKVYQLENTTSAQKFSMNGLPIPGTLWVRPNPGNTLTVEYSTDGVNFQSISSLTGATAYAETQVTSGFPQISITCSGTQGGTWGYC